MRSSNLIQTQQESFGYLYKSFRIMVLEVGVEPTCPVKGAGF